MRELRQVQWLRVAGDEVVLEGTRSLLSMESKRAVFKRRHMQFRAVMSVQNQHPKPLHLLSHQHKEVEVRREKEPSEVGVHLGGPIDSRAKTSWKVFALNYLVTIGIFPNVSLISQNLDANSAMSARCRTGRLSNNQIKSGRRVVTKMQWQN